MKPAHPKLPRSAEHLLAVLAGQKPLDTPRRHATVRRREQDIVLLLSADLLARQADGAVAVTPAGFAHLARNRIARAGSDIDPFRAQHLELAARKFAPTGSAVVVDDAESPLVWLARRKGRDGRMLIEPVQLQAGERLRAEFTRSQMMPRTTANWSVAVTDDRPSGGMAVTFTEAVIAARQRVRAALGAVGPEFSGLLLDVCCFLKGLADVESERGWPPRSAKVVLQLGLDRLARHYGLAGEARGRNHAPVRTWLAPDAEFVVEE